MIKILCDNCMRVIGYEEWQHRYNGRIYCSACYALYDNNSSIMGDNQE